MGAIHILNTTTGTVTIYSITGREMLTSKEKDIDVTGLPSGLYFIEFESEGMRILKKLVKF
jgi:hypothetical protein